MDLHSQSLDNVVSLSGHKSLFVKSYHVVFSDLNPECHATTNMNSVCSFYPSSQLPSHWAPPELWTLWSK